MDSSVLYQEYRLVERNEADVNEAWKGAHLLLLFLSFIFGSFCTFCFHILTYMFDENCVLFPKLLSISSQRHGILSDITSISKNDPIAMSVDFLNTQWADQSVCYMPKYMPLVSSICGLIWTTMFLMCSTGSQITGLQRPWRLLPYVFVFSVVIGCVCIYSSAVTHNGLIELCRKLGELTGSETCSYTVNVATLAYDRHVRGLYQAIYLTIITAWLHTFCWLISALLVLMRVFLAVDFQLIRVSAELRGNIDKMLEYHEEQIRSVSPDNYPKDRKEPDKPSSHFLETRVHFENKSFNTVEHYSTRGVNGEFGSAYPHSDTQSHIDKVKSEHKFITDLLHDLIHLIELRGYFNELQYESLPKMLATEFTKTIKSKHMFILELLYELVDLIVLAGYLNELQDESNKKDVTALNKSTLQTPHNNENAYEHEIQEVFESQFEPRSSTSGAVDHFSLAKDSNKNETTSSHPNIETQMTQKPSHFDNSETQSEEMRLNTTDIQTEVTTEVKSGQTTPDKSRTRKVDKETDKRKKEKND